jgi:hypothetical protein
MSTAAPNPLSSAVRNMELELQDNTMVAVYVRAARCNHPSGAPRPRTSSRSGDEGAATRAFLLQRQVSHLLLSSSYIAWLSELKLAANAPNPCYFIFS